MKRRKEASEGAELVAVDSGWLLDQFRQEFGEFADGEVHIARAPGRVNLIGEHTDYSGGFVLPVAIGHDVAIAFSARTDRNVSLYSCDYHQRTRFSLDEILPSADAGWSNYFRGVAWALEGCEYKGKVELKFSGNEGELRLCGLDAVISGDVPEGAGLSSSAAFEVASAISLLAAAGIDVALINATQSRCGLELRRWIALACQHAENSFVGVNCGIMDQMASCMGRADHAVYLDCRNLRHEEVELGLGRAEAALVIYDTGIRRGLVDSEYNHRRQEVELGTRMISGALRRDDIRTLRDIDIALFDEIKGILPSIVARRCEHVIAENERVQGGVEALKRGDLGAFGDLMWQSHESLRDLYGVSCPELDMAVEIARKTDGVLGARMTGAGFGGCTVSLVHLEALPHLMEALPDAPMRYGAVQPKTFVVDVVDGARIEE